MFNECLVSTIVAFYIHLGIRANKIYCEVELLASALKNYMDIHIKFYSVNKKILIINLTVWTLKF